MDLKYTEVRKLTFDSFVAQANAFIDIYDNQAINADGDYIVSIEMSKLIFNRTREAIQKINSVTTLEAQLTRARANNRIKQLRADIIKARNLGTDAERIQFNMNMLQVVATVGRANGQIIEEGQAVPHRFVLVNKVGPNRYETMTYGLVSFIECSIPIATWEEQADRLSADYLTMVAVGDWSTKLAFRQHVIDSVFPPKARALTVAPIVYENASEEVYPVAIPENYRDLQMAKLDAEQERYQEIATAMGPTIVYMLKQRFPIVPIPFPEEEDDDLPSQAPQQPAGEDDDEEAEDEGSDWVAPPQSESRMSRNRRINVPYLRLVYTNVDVRNADVVGYSERILPARFNMLYVMSRLGVMQSNDLRKLIAREAMIDSWYLTAGTFVIYNPNFGYFDTTNISVSTRGFWTNGMLFDAAAYDYENTDANTDVQLPRLARRGFNDLLNLPEAIKSFRANNVLALFESYKLFNNNPRRLNIDGVDNSPVLDGQICVVEALVKRYSKLPSDDRIAESKIRTWFGVNAPTRRDPKPVMQNTVSRLVEFGVEYCIPMHIKTVNDQTVFKTKKSTLLKTRDGKVRRTRARPAFHAIIYNQHIYPMEPKAITHSPEFRIKYTDEACDEGFQVVSTTVSSEKLHSDLIKAVGPSFNRNYQYDCERDIKARALCRSSNYGNVAADYLYVWSCYDMTKAYPTCLLNDEATPASMLIGVNQVCDIVEPYNGNDAINDAFTYFVSECAFSDLHERFGFHDNVLLGFEVAQLIKLGELAKSQITHVKPTSDFMKVGTIRDAFTTAKAAALADLKAQAASGIAGNDLDWVLADPAKAEDAIERKFNILNGILGINMTNPRRRIVRLTDPVDKAIFEAMGYTVVGDKPDAKFGQERAHDEIPDTPATFDPNAKVFKFHSTTGNSAFNPINSVNIYTFIVARTRYHVVKAVCAAKSAGHMIGAIKTDSFEILNQIQLDERYTKYNPTFYGLAEAPKFFKLEKRIMEFARWQYVAGPYKTAAEYENRTKFADGRLLKEEWFEDGIAARQIVFPKNGKPMAIKDVKLRNFTSYGRFVNPSHLRDQMLHELSKLNSFVDVVIGKPGSGKTHGIKEAGNYDIAVTVANSCANNLSTGDIKGQTLYSVLGHGRKDTATKCIWGIGGKKHQNGLCVFADEFSMFEPRDYSLIYAAIQVRNRSGNGKYSFKNKMPICVNDQYRMLVFEDMYDYKLVKSAIQQGAKDWEIQDAVEIIEYKTKQMIDLNYKSRNSVVVGPFSVRYLDHMLAYLSGNWAKISDCKPKCGSDDEIVVPFNPAIHAVFDPKPFLSGCEIAHEAAATLSAFRHQCSEVVRNPIRFIVAGDDNQIPSVHHVDICRERPTFFAEFAKDAKRLTTDYRNSKQLIKLRDDILNCASHSVSSADLHKRLQSSHGITVWNTPAKQASNVKPVDYPAVVHVVARKENQNRVNAAFLETYKLKVDFENGLGTDAGVQLISRRGFKSKRVANLNIVKGVLFRVVAVDKSKETIKLAKFDGSKFDKSDCIYVPSAKLGKYFDLGWAVTAHATQGLTIECELYIHNPGMMYKWDPRILYTAVTRAKSLEQLHFVASKFAGFNTTQPEHKKHRDTFDANIVDYDGSKYVKLAKSAPTLICDEY